MKKPAILLVLAGMLMSLFASAQDPSEENAYKKTLEQEREQKNERFRDPATSPISSQDMESFESLAYFDPDIRYKVDAEFLPLEEPTAVTLNTSDGNRMELMQYGKLTFTLDGKEQTLSVFRGKDLPEFSDNPGGYFVPFGDKTSGNETQANGRYVVVNLPEGSTTTELDFNRAFNPYSAYNSTYSSVLPPPENQLETLVMTGERKYEDR